MNSAGKAKWIKRLNTSIYCSVQAITFTNDMSEAVAIMGGGILYISRLDYTTGDLILSYQTNLEAITRPDLVAIWDGFIFVGMNTLNSA